MRAVLLGLALLAVVLVACQPDEDIAATIDARVATAIAGIPTPTPMPTPTPQPTPTPFPTATPQPTPTPTPTPTPSPTPTPTATPIPPATPTPVPTPTPSLEDAIARLTASVVRVQAGRTQGSGIVIDGDGFVLTNNHVVETATRVTVTLADGRRLQGLVVGRDEVADLAVIQVSGTGLSPATLGNSDELRLGETLIVLGYPLGLPGGITVTGGIFSARRPDPRTGAEYIQVDAALNPGNSGGPLMNSRGEVVGISTYVIRFSGVVSTEGLGFAISSNHAKPIVARLKGGEVVRATPTPRPADVEVYASTEFSYFLHYPRGWLLDESKKDAVVIRSLLAVASVTVEARSLKVDATLDEFVAFVLREAEVDEISRRRVTVGDVPGVLVQFRPSRQPDLVGRKLVTLRERRGYVVTAVAPERDFSYYSQAFDLMLNSFQLTG